VVGVNRKTDEHFRQSAYQDVPGRVPEPIIQRLQTIDIAHGDPRTGFTFVKRTPVRQPGLVGDQQCLPHLLKRHLSYALAGNMVSSALNHVAAPASELEEHGQVSIVIGKATNRTELSHVDTQILLRLRRFRQPGIGVLMSPAM
jgi:hypothetical protein